LWETLRQCDTTCSDETACSDGTKKLHFHNLSAVPADSYR